MRSEKRRAVAVVFGAAAEINGQTMRIHNEGRSQGDRVMTQKEKELHYKGIVYLMRAAKVFKALNERLEKG